MTLNLNDIVSFVSKVLHVVLQEEISIDKAFQKVKRTWQYRESYKIYYDVVESVLRNYFKLEFACKLLFKSTSCKNIVKTWLILHGLDYFKNKSQVVSFIKRLLKQVKFKSVDEVRDLVESNIEELKGRDIAEYLSVKYSYPRTFVEKLLTLLPPEDVEKMLDAMNNYHTWIRVNTLKIDVDKCVKLLEEQGLTLEQDRDVYFLFKVVASKRPVHHVEAIKQGLAVIQDKASVLTVLTLRPEPGDTILDLCAAPGMKTSLMLQLTENKCRVIAVDISEQRVHSMMYLLKHLGVNVDKVDILVADSRILKLREDIRVDKILVDAPCTSSGAIGKDPAVKISLRSLKRLPWYCDIQLNILKNSVHSWKDAEIVYATCSLLPEEGEEIIMKLVQEGCQLVKPNVNVCHGYARYRDVYDKVGRTFPHVHQCEGFFIARLQVSK